MNLEICKKCLKKKNLQFRTVESGYPYIDRKEEECILEIRSFRTNNITSVPHTKDRFRTTACRIPVLINDSLKFRVNYDKQEDIDLIELNDKACPYWMEHQIFDWNNRNE